MSSFSINAILGKVKPREEPVKKNEYKEEEEEELEEQRATAIEGN